MVLGVDFHCEVTWEGRIFPLRFKPCLHAPLLELAETIGVLDTAFLSNIRRWHTREHVPIREISCRLNHHCHIIETRNESFRFKNSSV